MKKIIFAAVAACIATAVFADRARVGTLRVADADTVSAAMVKFGELCGNPMVGMMSAASIARQPMGVEIPVYLDGRRPEFATAEAVALAKPLDGRLLELDTAMFKADLVIGDKGIDIKVKIPSSMLAGDFAQYGAEPLSADALAFAGADAVFASAGCWIYDPLACWEAVKPVLMKYSLIGDDYLVCSRRADGVVEMRFDYQRARAFFNANRDKFGAGFDRQAVNRELGEACRQLPRKLDNVRFVLAANDYSYTSATMAERFAATFPEAAGLKPCKESFFSLYSVLKPLTLALAGEMPGFDRDTAAAMIAALPSEGMGGIGAIEWRDGEALNIGFRVSADELRALGAYATMIMSAKSMEQR